MSNNPYVYEDYTSPYIKTEYVGTIRVRNPETGKMEDIETRRTVYRNTEWDPNLVIPAGTKIGTENVTEVDTTNLDRIKDGKSPVIAEVNENGEVVYDKVELHHLTAVEIQKGSQYFNDEERDGTLVEIRESKHDEYTKTLHNVSEKNVSFRTEKVTSVDEEGNTVRSKEKTYDNAHYNSTREAYWQDRATEILNERENEYVDLPVNTAETENAVVENEYVGIETSDATVTNVSVSEQGVSSEGTSGHESEESFSNEM